MPGWIGTYLVTSIGSAQKVADGCTGDGSGLSSITTIDGRDDGLGSLLLAEACLRIRQEERNENRLGVHGCGSRSSSGEYKQTKSLERCNGCCK